MLDKEKDDFIKMKLQQDKVISNKANDIFKNLNYENPNKQKNSNHKRINKILATAATFVIVIGAGGAVVIHNKNNINNLENDMIIAEETGNLTMQEPNSKANVYVKNEEAEVEDNQVVKQSENESVKVILTNDNKVLIQLKDAYIKKYNLNLNEEKKYQASKIEKNVKDVFVGYMGEEIPYVFLIIKDNTVECIQIENGNLSPSENYEFNFFDQGQVSGLYNITSFEQKSESSKENSKLYYYINAVRNDGVKKQIELGKYNDMSSASTNSKDFKSQDGKNTYSINANEGDYVQASGWAGASNNVYYINDSCLYHLSLANGDTKKLVTGVTKIWQEDDGRIVVKLKNINTIHEYDNNIVLCRYDVTDSKIVDTQENDSMIVNLKEDGSITLEFKDGGIAKISTAKTYYKEHIRYNVYASEYGKQEKAGDEIYADAKAILLGNIGIEQTVCITYITNSNKVIAINMLQCIESNFTAFTKVYSVGDYSASGNNPTSLEQNNISIKLQDGTVKTFSTAFVVRANGNKEDFATSISMNRAEYKNYTMVN